MNESGKKKEWIKNAVIIFLIIMLLLTLFSNTITNFSLPQVSTAYAKSGNITEKVRGTGNVEAGDTYVVKASETRTVSATLVSKGDHVEKGDVIYELEDVKSDELDKAEAELADIENKYLTAMFAEGVSDETITMARTGNYDTLSKMQSKVRDVEDRIVEAQKYVNECQNQVYVEKILTGIANTNVALDGLSITEEKALLDAEIEKLGFFNTTDEERIAEEKENRAKVLYDAQCKLAELKAADTINTEVTTDEKLKNELKVNNASTLLDTAKAHLEDLQREQKVLTTDMAAQIQLQSYADSIQRKQGEIEKLREKAMGATVVAPVAGKIQTLDCVSGEKMDSGKDICTIIPDGKDLILKISVDSKDAKKVKIGDVADVANGWNYMNSKLILSAISDDPDNPQNSILKFTVEGNEFKIGQSVSVSVGSQSRDYTTIVPKSALKSDNSGKYVFIVRNKNSALMNRYYAEKCNVTVLAEDDNNVAVQGELATFDYVITQSNKIVEPGKMVRLSENSEN